MKEINDWLGKTVTCPECGRKFFIEVSDKLLPKRSAYWSCSFRRNVRIEAVPASYLLLCGHRWPLPEKVTNQKNIEKQNES